LSEIFLTKIWHQIFIFLIIHSKNIQKIMKNSTEYILYISFKFSTIFGDFLNELFAKKHENLESYFCQKYFTQWCFKIYETLTKKSSNSKRILILITKESWKNFTSIGRFSTHKLDYIIKKIKNECFQIFENIFYATILLLPQHI